MRVVLDTNVIVAAFATRGLCAEVFEVCLMDHTVVLSEYILSEVREKLLEKIGLPETIVDNIIEYLIDMGHIVQPAHIKESICNDKTDLPVIGTALSGKATCIITGDKDLLLLRKYKNVDIITPREFWNKLRE